MKKVQIKATINAANPNHVTALGNFLTIVGGTGAPLNEIEVKAAEQIQPAPAASETTATETQAAPAAESTTHEASQWSEEFMKNKQTPDQLKVVCTELGIDFAAVDGLNTNAKLRRLILEHFKDGAGSSSSASEAPAETKGDADGPTLDDLRAAVTKNAGKHREAMRTKIVELGAKNVAALDPKHYQDFLDFINSLE